MKSHYLFEKENNHLYIKVTGEYDFNDFKTYLKIIYAKCEQEDIFNMIMNALNVEGIDIPTLERYYLGVEAAQELKYKVKLAVVWHKEYTNYLAETVAVNRGGRIKIFDNVESATEWIQNGHIPELV
jgi:hypothetical protein